MSSGTLTRLLPRSRRSRLWAKKSQMAQAGSGCCCWGGIPGGGWAPPARGKDDSTPTTGKPDSARRVRPRVRSYSRNASRRGSRNGMVSTASTELRITNPRNSRLPASSTWGPRRPAARASSSSSEKARGSITSRRKLPSAWALYSSSNSCTRRAWELSMGFSAVCDLDQ